eukprot:1024063-Prymnesium_polylepis.1
MFQEQAEAAKRAQLEEVEAAKRDQQEEVEALRRELSDVRHAAENLPIEHTVSKRRKLVGEMCDSMKAELDQEVEDVVWSELGELKPESAGQAVEQLEMHLSGLASHSPEWYNVDAQLTTALTMAVDAKTAVSSWPMGLELLQQQCRLSSLMELFEAEAVEVRGSRDGKPPVGPEGGYGACALLLLGTKLQELNLPGNRLGATGAEALGFALKRNTTLRSLNLAGSQHSTNITTAGAVHLFVALETNATLTRLSLADNALSGVDDKLVDALRGALQKNCSLADLDLRYNRSLGKAVADAVLKAKAPLRRLNLLNTSVGVRAAQELTMLDFETL